MKEFYVVKVEGREFKTEFSYGGLRECQKFIADYGKPDKKYTIKYRKEKAL